MIRLLTGALCVIALAPYIAESQYDTPYIEVRSTTVGEIERNLVEVLKNDTIFDDIGVSIDSSELTVTASNILGVAALVDVIDIVTSYYGNIADRVGRTDVKQIRIVWDKVEDSSGAEMLGAYRRGVSGDLTALIAYRDSAELVDLLSIFARYVSRFVPSDNSEPGDNDRLYPTDLGQDGGGSIHTTNERDADWFKYRVEESGAYIIETKPSSKSLPMADTMIDVFVGEYMNNNDDGGEHGYSRVVLCATAQQDIDINVKALFRGAGYYSLHVDLADDQIVNCAAQIDEADSFGESVAVDYRAGVSGALHLEGDVDWFQIEGLKQGEIYEITIASSVRGIQGTLRVGKQEHRLTSRTMRFLLKSEGAVYLKIDVGVGGDEGGKYFVRLKEVDAPLEL